MIVKLTNAQYQFASLAGALRQAENAIKGYKPAHGFRGDPMAIHIEGAAAEFAVAKALGLFWGGPGEFGGGDVGQYIQVRSSALPAACLLIHREDGDSAPFILATGGPQEYVLRGWVYGWDGKRKEFWKDPTGGRPAFFVPQSALKPMSALVDMIKGTK